MGGTNIGGAPLFPGVPPAPEPEHQRRIDKERWFEIGAVITIIVLGTGYVMWSGRTPTVVTSGAESLAEAGERFEKEGFEPLGESVIFGRKFMGFRKSVGIFECYVEVIGEAPEAPLETVLIWLVPGAGVWAPSEGAMQAAVDAVAKLGSLVVPSSGEALEKAVNTMVYISDSPRPHDKGVAGTRDGWKITYVTYRSFNDDGEAEPALYLVVQRLSVGADRDLSAFNRSLYRAIGQGRYVKPLLKSAEAERPAE